MANTVKVRVVRSASLGLEASTLESLTAAATSVGAPATATVTTGGGTANANVEGTYYPYSVTFSWTEDV